MELTLERVTLSMPGVCLIQPFSLTIQAGEIVTLMGPSGSGKSSLLAYVAGDLTPPLHGAGRVSLGGRQLNAVPPEARKVGRLFQDDYLFPHMSVGENLLFGMKRGPRHDRQAMMRLALQEAGIEGLEARAPHTLSGGQRQRVALMRALMAKPDAMLLDEPFNKLDMELRASMRAYVFSHLLARQIPCLLVTHDRADAPGRVLAIGPYGVVRA